MPFPFRNPVAGDGDPPEWSPPSYAKSVDDSEGWQPPEYAKAIESKPKKQSVFSKIKEFLTPSDKLDVTKAMPALTRQFLEEHPYTKDVGRRFLSGPSSEEVGGREIQGPGIMKTPGVEKATDWLSQKITGSEGNLRLGLGAITKAVGGMLEGGF